MRYDDLVEAVGTAVENDQAPWNSDNSVDLSTHASALLVLTAAVLIFTGGRGNYLGLITGLAGTLLASLACALISRSTQRLAPLSLAHSIPILAGSAVMSAIPGSWSALPLAGFGIAAIVSAAILLIILPKNLHGSIAAPLTYGFSAAIIGLLTGFGHLSTQRSASAIYTLLIVLILIAPWFAMARIPIRVTGNPETIDAYQVVLVSAIGSAILMPQALIPIVLLLFIATGLVLALTVIDPKMRPWVTRIADTLSLISLLALVPITTLVWGIL